MEGAVSTEGDDGVDFARNLSVTGGGGRGSKLREDKRRLLDILRRNFSFSALGVGGADAQLHELVRRILAPRLVPHATRAALDLRLVRGALLHGPPGTGKSLIASRRDIAELRRRIAEIAPRCGDVSPRSRRDAETYRRDISPRYLAAAQDGRVAPRAQRARQAHQWAGDRVEVPR